MKKRNKIIFITKSGRVTKRKLGVPWLNPKNESFYWGKGISHFIARDFIENKLNIDIEIWRMDDQVENVTFKQFKGFSTKIFPYRTFAHLPFSIDLIKDIKHEVKNNNLLIWFDGVRYPLFSIIAFFFPNTKLVAHAMGGANYLYKYKTTKKIKFYLAFLFDRISLVRNLNLAILGADGEFQYFKKVNIAKQIMSGIDLNRFKVINKIEAREKLGLPTDKKIILQMGRAFSFKGTEVTVNAWSKHLKNKGVLLYLTGIHETDEHYDLIKKSGCDFRGYVEHELIPYWLAAADVYVYPPFDEITLNFAGVGYAPLEALACGTPIVCTTARFLKFYNIDAAEYDEFIKIPAKSEEDVANSIENLLEVGIDPSVCNRFIREHFSKDEIYKKLVYNLSKISPTFFDSSE